MKVGYIQFVRQRNKFDVIADCPIKKITKEEMSSTIVNKLSEQLRWHHATYGYPMIRVGKKFVEGVYIKKDNLFYYTGESI